MRNYLGQVGLWAYLWGIINEYRETQTIVGNTIPLEGIPEQYKRKES